MTRTYLRKRQQYTTFKKLPKGARFRVNSNGPFVKISGTRYEDARAGDDVAIAATNVKVRRLWRVGIEPN